MSRRADAPSDASTSVATAWKVTRIAVLGLLLLALVAVPDVTLAYRLAVGSLHGTELVYALISCVAVTFVVYEGTLFRVRRWRG